MKMLRSIALNAGTLALALILAIVACEGALRLLVPGEQHYYVLRPHMREVLEPDPRLMPGNKGPVHYDVNSRGIRGREFAVGTPEYQVLAVGGSTTELLFVDEKRSWPFLVQQSLGHTPDGRQVWVGNAGRSGLNARDHVVEVKYLTTEYPDLKQLVVLTGVNDLTVALHDGGHYVLPPPVTEPAAERQQIRRAFQVAPGSLAHPTTEEDLAADAAWYKATAVYQLLKRGKTRLLTRNRAQGLAEDARGQMLGRWQQNRAHAVRVIDTLPDLTAPLLEYRRNLNAIVDIAAARHLPLLFLTQPSLWRADLTPAENGKLWLGGIGDFQTEPGHAYYATSALTEGMRRYNEVMLDVCRVRRVDCLDIGALVPKDTTMFYDDVHFTDLGSSVVARELSAFLRQRPPFAGRRDGIETDASLAVRH